MMIYRICSLCGGTILPGPVAIVNGLETHIECLDAVAEHNRRIRRERGEAVERDEA